MPRFTPTGWRQLSRLCINDIRTAWRRIISKFQRADEDDDRSRLNGQASRSRRGGPRQVLRLIPRFDRLRPTAERLRGCGWPLPELLTAMKPVEKTQQIQSVTKSF